MRPTIRALLFPSAATGNDYPHFGAVRRRQQYRDCGRTSRVWLSAPRGIRKEAADVSQHGVIFS